MRKLVVVGFALVLLSFNPLVGAYKESDQLNGGETTHQFMMDRIPIILENDGYPYLADYLILNLDQMKYGSMRADETIWDSREHYMDPSTHNGYLTFKSAGTLAYETFTDAVTQWNLGFYTDALFNLGWSTHLVQDLTVPHHSYVTALNSHAEYEQFAYDNQQSYPVSSGGIYNFSFYLPGHYENELSAMDWVDYNAHFSYSYYTYVNGPDGQGDNDYAYAANILLPRAQKTSAGYVYMFFSTVNTGPTLGEGWDRREGMRFPVDLSPRDPQDDMGIANYTWEFGDGTFAYERDVSHQYTWPGTYLCNLTIRDAFGLEASDQIEIEIWDDVRPVAVAGPDLVIPEGGTVHLDGSGSYDNIGITEISWSFNYVTISNTSTVSHTFPKYGEYIIYLNVWDAGGRSDYDEVIVTVLDMEPPVADAGPDLNVYGSRFVKLIALNSTDDNGIVLYHWDCGNGASAYGVDARGCRYQEPGIYTVTLTVTDVSGNNDTDTMIIQSVQSTPEVVPHSLGPVVIALFFLADIMAAFLLMVVVRIYRKTEETLK
jgi:PKD repeat protein